MNNIDQGQSGARADVVVAPELNDFDLPDRADGPGGAMIVSAGIGAAVLGLFTVLAELSPAIKSFLQSFEMGMGVGPLAGKVILASLAYFASLALLWILWKDKNVDLKKMFIVGGVLGLLGFLGTFPPFFQMFTAG